MLKKLLLALFLIVPCSVSLANGIVGSLFVVVTEVESYGSQKIYFVAAPSKELFSLAQKMTPDKNIIRLVIEGENYYAFSTYNSKEGVIDGRFFGSTARVKIIPSDLKIPVLPQ